MQHSSDGDLGAKPVEHLFTSGGTTGKVMSGCSTKIQLIGSITLTNSLHETGQTEHLFFMLQLDNSYVKFSNNLHAFGGFGSISCFLFTTASKDPKIVQDLWCSGLVITIPCMLLPPSPPTAVSRFPLLSFAQSRIAEDMNAVSAHAVSEYNNSSNFPSRKLHRKYVQTWYGRSSCSSAVAWPGKNTTKDFD
ncbi:hypothetical protein J6590_004830 [Homalodisca vitripennis]|nr:hypothetical protein J6590_004830 [Homalodisca vitripennis]